MKTYKELYQTENTYRVNGIDCEVIETRKSKTGRISAKVKNKVWGEFWTSSVKPETEITTVHANKCSLGRLGS